tara:strand:- start:1457 stop:2647 length:1191 start_codon:yes stop_codon:yes gene_type:complete
MTTELIVPTLGESITEATVSKWLKNIGDSFEVDEPLVEIETDKITVEVPAPSSGVITEIKVQEGKEVNIGGVLAIISESNENKKFSEKKEKVEEIQISQEKEKQSNIVIPDNDQNKLSPSVKKIIQEKNIELNQIQTSREDGRLTKADVIEHLENSKADNMSNQKLEEVVPISKIRKTIAKRLKEAQNTAAILTTFNEVDMSEIIKVRDTKKDQFMKRYEVKLGFMSFFIKASVIALKEFSAVNAEIREDKIIYKNHYDIGIAVGTEKGLVVPVLKNADKMTFGDIEKKIVALSDKAREGKLTMDDLSGGTFTISNGGVYGSMLSTPIINRPQSGILGMHNIVKRPYVVNDEIVIRPVMYLAFSYDHRIIDGKESVGFLLKIKELLENPSSLILGI